MKVFETVISQWSLDYAKIEQSLYGTILFINNIYIDNTYNDRMVIDIISDNNLIELFKVSKVSIIIEAIWQGRYEMGSFLNFSLNYEIIKTIFFKQVS